MAQPYVIIPPSGSDQAEEWLRLGVEAHAAGKFPEAEKYYRHALRLDPRHAMVTQNLGVLFAQMGNLNEALLTIERAAIFNSKHPIISANRAFMCLEADRLDDALASAQAALDSCPHVDGPISPVELFAYLGARLALAMTSTTAGLPDRALPLYREVLEKEPKHQIAGPNSCFVQTLMATTPKDLLAQRRQWYEANRFDGKKEPHDNNRNHTRPLRVGYVSGDFKRHSAAMIFGAVVLYHDKNQIETYLYSSLPVNQAADEMTKRFMDVAGPNWRNISAMADEQADALIRRDKIDILVDLAGHTNGGRLGLFTRKPAPVQVTAWGFAHGTGVPEIDYFFADAVVVPPEEVGDYAEKIIYLPCVVTYLPPVEYNIKGRSMLPYHKNEYITFGSYARYEKISDQCLATFAEILRRAPEAKLEFKDHAFRRPYAIKRILAAMPDIAPDRILFSISTSHPDHLLAYQQADLLLDPFPHGGGVVGLEQLYMGVPIVTLYGTQPAGRTTSSALTAMGLSHLVAKTPEEYVDIAVKLSVDIPALQKARKELQLAFLESPVIKGYRETVEIVYREIWKTWAQ